MYDAMFISLPRNAAPLRRRWASLAIAAWLVVPAVAVACSVPVFRFALEQWRPDAYQVFVYHDQDLSEEQTQWIVRLRERGSADANVQVQTIDLRSEPAPLDRGRGEALTDASLPRMLVKLPKGIGGGEVVVGDAAFQEQEIERLLDSPARHELAQRLIDGQVVWVFLGSGNATQDDVRMSSLEAELMALQQTLKLPAIAPEDRKAMSVEPEALQIRFSALRVDRNDPAEKWFADMLLSVEPDLRDEELVGEAMVFPVFGRGRALYALVGLGINPDMIKQAAEFLTGPCQCTVKVENPGVDLLLPVRWDDQVVGTEPAAVSLPLVGLGGYQQEPEDVLPIFTAKSEPAEDAILSVERKPLEPAAATVMAAALGQVDVDVTTERSAIASWLPWIVMILLAVVVVVASLGFFRRY